MNSKFEDIEPSYIKASEGELDQLAGMVGDEGWINAEKLVIDTRGDNLLVIESANLSNIEIYQE